MGFSQLKIPKICEHCGKAFEAKTVVTRFYGSTCANKFGKEKKRQQKASGSISHKILSIEEVITKCKREKYMPWSYMFGN
jgi:hypothetical protein